MVLNVYFRCGGGIIRVYKMWGWYYMCILDIIVALNVYFRYDGCIKCVF
jgi:hypothetical protein